MRFTICLSREDCVVAVWLHYVIRQHHERRLAFALLRFSAVALFIFADLVDEAYFKQGLTDLGDETRIPFPLFGSYFGHACRGTSFPVLFRFF